MPSPGYRVSGKEVEVCDSGSRHHQLCGCRNLQPIQRYEAPSHGPPARVLSPLFFPAKSLLLPKPHGKKKHSKTSWSSLLSFRTVWSFSPFQNRVVLFLSPQNLMVLLFTPEPCGPLFTSEPHGLPFLWLPGLGLNPSAHLPLQPHFQLLLQSVTPASIPYSSSFTGLL